MDVKALTEAVSRAELVARRGEVVAVRGQIVVGRGPAARIGERCRIDTRMGQAIAAEVIGFSGGDTVLMPLDSIQGISVGASVIALGVLPEVPVGEALLGRVVDAMGQPLDDLGPLAAVGGLQRRALMTAPLNAMRRRRVDQVLDTGVAVVDTMMTLAKGQRIGLFAAGGVGKSTLMGMLARGVDAPVNVIALVGERSREVREFVEDQLGVEGMRRSVVVVATAAESAVMRVKAAYAATAIAEHFRDEGKDVLLLMDSLTRFAMARREIGLAVGEPPTARGYTPSVFSELPQLCERAGPGDSGGSITGVYTVLVEGDDLNEPVSDTARATLDGHFVLSREIANAGQFPAVDVLQSISRVQSTIVAEQDLAAARTVLACCALYERNRQLVEIGAHKAGVNPPLDRAVKLMPRVRQLFTQSRVQRVPRADSLQKLRQLAALLEAPYAP